MTIGSVFKIVLVVDKITVLKLCLFFYLCGYSLTKLIE